MTQDNIQPKLDKIIEIAGNFHYNICFDIKAKSFSYSVYRKNRDGSNGYLAGRRINQPIKELENLADTIGLYFIELAKDHMNNIAIFEACTSIFKEKAKEYHLTANVSLDSEDLKVSYTIYESDRGIVAVERSDMPLDDWCALCNGELSLFMESCGGMVFDNDDVGEFGDATVNAFMKKIEHLAEVTEWLDSLPEADYSRRKYKEMLEYINDICGFLQIERPKLSVAKPKIIHEMLGPYTSACFIDDSYQIVISDATVKEMRRDISFWFQIAHELRHAWQATKGKDQFQESYSDILAKNGYDNNIYEIDANAFAVAFVRNVFDFSTEELKMFDFYNNMPVIRKKFDVLVNKLYKEVEKHLYFV